MMLESASRPCFGHHNKGLPQSIRFIRSTKIIPRGRESQATARWVPVSLGY